MNKTIRIATRQSRLALWQAHWVKLALEKVYPGITVILLPMTTKGDQKTDVPLMNIGGKAVFVKALQSLLLDKRADIAVHCVKDMSVHPTPGLTLGAICKREDPRDVFISNTAKSPSDLKPNAIIGTGSPRRASLVKSIRPDCQIKLLRGNVETRLSKLDNDDYDAIILAAAGLHRLQLSSRITAYLDPDYFTPAIGQGALAIECREADLETQSLLDFLNDPTTASCIAAEQAVNQTLHGDCHTPLGAYAVIVDDQLQLNAMVGSSDGQTVLRADAKGLLKNAKTLGHEVAKSLLNQGAQPLLNTENSDA